MADVTFHSALGDFGLVLTSFDQATLVIVSSNKTTAVMEDANGACVEFTGTHLAFDGQNPTGGTLTGVTLISAASDTLTIVTSVSLDAITLFATFQTGGLFAVEFAIIAANDHIQGSSKADYMIGLEGNDATLGGAGTDVDIADGAGDHLILQNFDLANLGRGDFDLV